MDIAILDGSIVDGTGSIKFTANIGISNDRIVYLGTDKNLIATKTIDAHNLIVAPGFIDGHSHADRFIQLYPNRFNESALYQGVTTVVGGADGQWSPNELQGLLDKYLHNGIATNIAFYVGHNGIRSEVMGKASRLATSSELNSMKELVEQGMKMGAVGLSTGLMYNPGKYSNTQEVIELAKVAAEYGGVYDSHVRDPINSLIESDREVITIAKEANIPAKIGHVKAVCLRNQGLSNTIISLVEKARNEGLNVVTDQYPYDGAKTEFLSSLINVPNAISKRRDFSLKRSLSDPKLSKILQRHSEVGVAGQFNWLKVIDYDCIRITHSTDFPQLEGQYLSELAEELKIQGFEVMSKLLIDANDPIRVTFGGVDEQDVQNILPKPWNMIVSDGYYVNDQSPNSMHPRSTGTFARVLGHYVRELKLLSLEEAIRKMTSAPAQFLKLKDRGIIKVGAIADLVIFDERKVKARSSWSQPKRYATGFKVVLVNGQLVINNGELTGAASGKYLSRSSSLIH